LYGLLERFSISSAAVHTQAFIYMWTHIESGMWYIGSRTQRGCHPNDGYICSSKIVKPMVQASPSEWRRTVLCIGGSSEIRALEVELLNLRDAKNDPMSFNRSNGDKGWSTTGLRMTEKSRDLWLKKNKGKKRSPEVCARMSEQYQSRCEEAKAARVAKALATRALWSDEMRAKVSLSISTSRVGKPLSEQHIKNLSISHLGYAMTLEHRQKIAAAHKGRPKTPEHIAKVVAANKGKPRGPWSEARRAAHERKKAGK
jgi:hypothetical protein